MSLKKCEECGKEYSNKATQCPNCGNPTNDANYKKQANNTKKTNNKQSPIVTILSAILFIGIISFLYIKMSSIFDGNVDKSKYDTKRIYTIGDTLICPNFEIKIDSVQIKEKGTAIDSYQVISDPEWIGVTLTVKNISGETKTFYGSDVNVINSNGEVLDHSFVTYKIWGAELLNSPELVSGGLKTGYIQFSNNDTDNSNLILKIDCDTGLFDDDIIYKVNISQ